MANDAQMPERIARIIRENLSGVTSIDPDIRAAQEDDLMRTAELIAADLCASGQQVRAVVERLPRYDIDVDGDIMPDPTGEYLERSDVLAALTPAPQVDAEHCGCGDKACLACFPSTTPPAQEAEPVDVRKCQTCHGFGWIKNALNKCPDCAIPPACQQEAVPVASGRPCQHVMCDHDECFVRPDPIAPPPPPPATVAEAV